jgi:hypothetical protein
MNLNANNRLESFDLSVCDEMTMFYENLADEIWRRVDGANRSQSAKVFEDLLLVESVRNPRRANPFMSDAA